jgi:hypothetical protein
MTHSRQSKSSLALRLGAVVSLLVWVAASSFCLVESLIGADHHAAGAAQHGHDVAASADSDHHSHDSDKKDGDEHACCSTLTAAAPSAHQTVLPKPDFGKPLSFNLLWLSQALTFVHPEAPISRQPPDREWVFTPEVCLGPAFRSNAPPFCSLS